MCRIQEREGGRPSGNTLHRHVQDRSMGAKGKPLLDLTPPLERGQRLLEAVRTAPDGLLLVSSSGHLGALSLYRRLALDP